MSKLGEQIAQMVQQFQEEDSKFDSGNKAAGTRARKALLELKKLADARRKEIQAVKNED
jgi:Histone H1-like protein Hc1